MKVFIDGIEYPIRHNYLHRGISRVVLNVKENGRYVSVQVDRELPIKNFDSNIREFVGYWCYENGTKEVRVKIENIYIK